MSEWKKIEKVRYVLLAVLMLILVTVTISCGHEDKNKHSKKTEQAKEYFRLGNAKDDKGDYNGAIKDYDEAIRLNPDYAEAYNNRGIAKREKGDYDGAIADYNEAIRLKPDLDIAYGNKGIIRIYQNKFDEAYELFRKAVRRDSEIKKAISGSNGIIRWLCDPKNKDSAQQVRDRINKIIAPEKLKECKEQQQDD